MDALTMQQAEAEAGIHGAALHRLGIMPSEGGPVLHMLRADAPLFSGFGEVYFSEVLPGAIKAWKLHSRQTQQLAVPLGLLRFVLFDPRPGSPSYGQVRAHLVGRPDHYRLLRIPPGIWYGFENFGTEKALICNCANLMHEPSEASRKPRDSADIPWRFGPDASGAR